MRLKVLEKMFRDQYCLRDEDQVEVNHVYTQGSTSQYLIKDRRTVDGVTTQQETTITMKIRRKHPEVIDIRPDCRCNCCKKLFSSKLTQKAAIPKHIVAASINAPTSLPTCPHCGYMFFFKLPKIIKGGK